MAARVHAREADADVGGVWPIPPGIRLPIVAHRNGHAEIVWDDKNRSEWARCTWCHSQSRGDGKRGGELAKPCRTWCFGCDLVTRDEIHSGEVAHPDFPGVGQDLPDGYWLCPKCVPRGE